MITNSQLFNACKYINENDKNSDILDMYSEYLENEISFDSILECVTNILMDWLEDLQISGLSNREIQIFDSLGIEHGLDYKTMYENSQKLIENIHNEYMRLVEENKELKQINEDRENIIASIGEENEKIFDELENLKEDLYCKDMYINVLEKEKKEGK